MGVKKEGGGNPNGGSPKRLNYLAKRGVSKIKAQAGGEFVGTDRATRKPLHQK